MTSSIVFNETQVKEMAIFLIELYKQDIPFSITQHIEHWEVHLEK